MEHVSPLAASLAISISLALCAPRVLATPYEVLYDANTPGVFPEDLGWQRFTSQGGAARTVENGIFTLMAQNPNPNGGFDQYLWDAMETLDPNPGEMFYAEWRLRLLPGSNNSDVGIFIVPDGMQRAFSLDYTDHSMLSSRDNRRLDLDTTEWHTYRLESLDMIDYLFHVDGAVAWEGFFAGPTGFSSWVIFGDRLDASASASQWDFFRFGVTPVPEPCSVILLISCGLASVRRRKSRSQTPRKEDQTCLESQHFW